MRDNVWYHKERQMLRAAQLEGRRHGLEIESIEVHPNGVGGARFHNVAFSDLTEGGQRLLGVIFDAPTSAILDRAALGPGNFRRGKKVPADRYDGALRKVIKAWLAAEADFWKREKA